MSERVLRKVNWGTVRWDDLVPRLMLFTANRLRHVGAHSADIDDFVYGAITKTISGQRVWNPERTSLFEHFAGVIRSDISHHINTSKRFAQWPDEAEDTFIAGEDVEEIVTSRVYAEKIIERLRSIDDNLATMARLILVEEMDTPQSLAMAMNIEVEQVYNIRKRLRREMAKQMDVKGS